MTPDELNERLRRVLGAHEVRNLTRLSGGASRETWALDAVDAAGAVSPLICQRQRTGGAGGRAMGTEAAALRAAHAAGVPVAEVVAASSTDDDLGAPFLVVRRIEGETIARKILRDEEFADARPLLAAQLGAAAARIHTIDPAAVEGIEPQDPLARYRDVLDLHGEPHPAFELGFRWLERTRPAPRPATVVHGDLRLGNVIVGPDGLRAVLDWELVHLGNPVEDLSWLCVKAWRFGSPLPVAGIGEREALLAAYHDAGGAQIEVEELRWWEAVGTLMWGVMCMMQASAHTSGLSRSHELAAIGRRVCENEWDLLAIMKEAS